MRTLLIHKKNIVAEHAITVKHYDFKIFDKGEPRHADRSMPYEHMRQLCSLRT